MNHIPYPEVETDTHVFFWGSVYSNWYERKFKWRDLTFKNSETAFMYAKAVFFKDESTARKILESSHDPSETKQMGREVTPYDDDLWSEVREEIMFEILCAKFSQHDDLKQVLTEHSGKHIVEASPYDRIWGIGLHWTNERIYDFRNWRGDNLLGKALMKVQVKMGLRKSIPII